MKKDHTGFRNGDLFCFHCGSSQKMPLPMPANLAAEWMMGFAKVHKDCPKTWEEPANNPENKTVEENLMWWLANGEHGISSKTMAKHLGSSIVNIPTSGQDHPHDPSDFYRCHKLLEAVPQFRQRLHLMKNVSPAWSNLVDNWRELTELLKEQMETKKDNGMYQFMQTLIS